MRPSGKITKGEVVFKNILNKNSKYLSGAMFAVLVSVLFGLVGCDKKEAPAPENKKENAAAQEIIRKIQEPQEKVRELEKQLLERDERNKKLADQM